MKNNNLLVPFVISILTILSYSNSYSQQNDNVDKSFLGIDSSSGISMYNIENTNKTYPLDFILKSKKTGKYNGNNSILTLEDIDNKTIDFKNQGAQYDLDFEKGISNDFPLKVIIIKECEAIFYSKSLTYNDNGDLQDIKLKGQLSIDKSEMTVKSIKNAIISFYGNKFSTVDREETKSVLMVWEGLKFRLFFELKAIGNGALEVNIIYGRI